MNDLREKIAIALAERFEFPMRWHELRYNTQEYNRHTADVIMPIVREAVEDAVSEAFDNPRGYRTDIVKRICG